MTQPVKVVAVLISNPALSSILSMVLAATPSLRVRPFESAVGLSTYMQLAPVDLVVCDFDGAEPADVVARQLDDDAGLKRPGVKIIALASTVNAETKRASIRAGITEIIMKPMSPKYLLERVLSHLDRLTPRPAPRPRAVSLRRELTSNVVPLFGRQPQPLH